MEYFPSPARYYEVFPPKNTKTRIEVRDGRKSVILTEDVPAGEIIYEEKPVVAVLDADLQESGEYCAHCFRSVEPEMAVIMTSNNPISSIFCSEVCLDANTTQSHKLLFTTEPPLPPQMSPPMPAESQEARRQAQEKFVDYVKNEKRSVPLLVARFIARQVAVETSRLAQAERQPSDFTDADGGEYQLADHIERLRYVENHPASEERLTLVDVLRTALPGLEQFVTEEGHATVAGKLAYNAFGVCFGTGRDDKPAPTARPEDIERTRTPYGTSRQIGTAFYTLSCYLPHSCSPNARPSFDLGTNELQLIADRDLKKGDTLSVAYVDVTRREDETIVECRRRRRIELARGWRFACQCSRCAEESSELSSEEKAAEAELKKDESVVDAAVRHEEDGSSTNAK
ncbi:hypothetical protein H0H93_010816 [Arthromyces matolae]|nr:hypothetical protein H0H93_010816 [Arthromyces matolae]